MDILPANSEFRSFPLKLGEKAAYLSCGNKIGDYFGSGS
ncbi:MAG: hypothetical protein AMDU5_GPLC00016G0013 [Thermoplasmatales archaeon Gpl]|nr:MAG: hypothetical protein AMDU5_GPLC00016G0013 [Thermoplasmatales archaeon Gpl]